MIAGQGTIANYNSYISNCQAGQMSYRIPVNNLADVQLYVYLGSDPSTMVLAAMTIELIHTCGPTSGQIEALTTTDYVVGQDSNGSWYGVFKNLTGATPTCFVVAITFTFDTIDGPVENIYFSEEYCVENICNSLTLIKGCYGNLNNQLAYDCEDIYFGTHAGPAAAMGNTSIKYNHELYLRHVEVTKSAIKNTFKQGRTRSFRTEKEKIFQFSAEFVPAWYMDEIDAVFYRGEVYVGGIKRLVNETQFEQIEPCKQMWKPAATFKESCYKSFSCETNPCDAPAQVCCDPVIISVDVTDTPNGSNMNTIVIEARVGQTPVVTGTSDPVTGISAGSTVISCSGFAGVRVQIERGHIPLYSIDETDGTAYYTKVLADGFITLSVALVEDELLYIQTIPA